MRLNSLLDMPDLRLRLLVGRSRLDRPVRRVYTTDLADPGRYLAGGELVLTGMLWRRPDRAADDAERFVAALAAGRAAALAAGYADAEVQRVPEDVVAACRRHDLALFEVPADVSFATVTERVVAALAAERGDTEPGTHWRDRLSALVDADPGPDPVCALLAAETGADCWVISPGGRQVAGRPALPDADRARLARQFLLADRLPAPVRLGGRSFTLLPVSPRQHRVANWCLVLAGDQEGWPAEARGAVTEVRTLLALERARHDEAFALAGRQGEQLVRLALSDGAAPADVASRLAVAGFEPDEPMAVLVATAGPGTSVPLPAVLHEICAGHAGRSVVTTVDDEAVAILAVDVDRFDTLVRRVRDGAEALRPGLGSTRISVGISAAPASASGLRTAIEEARHVRRLGEHRPGQVRVAESGELASHGLLLATVPEDLRRSFRARLIGPLIRYDRAHRSDLVATLDAFLDCDGSWTRCSERLHLHVNTLRYRIGRIEQLTGRNLASFSDRVDLYLALRLG